MDKYINPTYVEKLIVERLGDELGRICMERLSDGMAVVSFDSGAAMLEMAIGGKSEACVVSKASKRGGNCGREFTKALSAGLSNRDVANVFIEEALG